MYSQNINGMKLDSKGGDIPSIAAFLQHYQCDVVGFSELNLDVSKYSIKSIMYNNFHRLFDSVQFSAASSEIPFDGFYKPGGTLTATFDHVTSWYHSKYSDPLGRWSSITLTAK